MHRLLNHAGTAILLGLMIPVHALAAEPPDLTKIDRRIVREPKYISKRPLYGLYVFGPRAATRAWAVLDKSKAEMDEYDVLYFDRNANGDLTEPGERLTGSGKINVGTFKDPGTGDVHENLTISRKTDGSVFIRMIWKGKEPVVGGYAEDPGPYCQFAESPEKCDPLACAEGPLAFGRRVFDKSLPVGGSGDARVFLGHQGFGPNTFCAVTQDFLPPDVPVLATLIYTDGMGRERRSQNELRERC